MIYKHIADVEAKPTFSKCLKYRYRLDISLKTAAKYQTKTVCAIMQNPSVADSDIADKSVQFLEKLVFAKNTPRFSGVRKLIVVNQFAFIQTKEFSGRDKHIGQDNDRHIKEAITESDIILIAWGKSNAYEARRQAINRMLENCNKVLLQGKSHPSRASYDEYTSVYSI